MAPDGMLQKAAALSTGAFQVATISGPALGGLIYAVAPGAPYALMAFFWFLAALLSGAIELDRPIPVKEQSTLAGLFAGVGFVRRNPAILGSISLDLAAVLLGGATALLPIYARDILHTGPWGLGVPVSYTHLGKLRHALAIVAIRNMAGGKCQDCGGNELHQPHHAEVERATCQRINLPTNRHRSDLVAELGKAAGCEIKQEGAVAQEDSGAAGRDG